MIPTYDSENNAFQAGGNFQAGESGAEPLYGQAAPGDSEPLYGQTAPGASEPLYGQTAPGASEPLYGQTAPGASETAFSSGNSHGAGENADKGSQKKKGGAGRFFALVGSALLFGLIAGITMVGVNRIFAPTKTLSQETQERTTTVTIGKPVVEKAAVSERATDDDTAVALPGSLFDVSAIVETAMPSVVAIKGSGEVRAESWFGQYQRYESNSSGSGIIIGKSEEELLIVTNNHVIENMSQISVVFIDDSEVKATLKGGDSETDVAIIAVKLSDIDAETAQKLEVATIGDSENLKVGQGVVAIGNALGYGQSVTVGYISALDREVQIDRSTTRNLLQTDAAINPGNSGGALLNMWGEVIAINSAKYSSTSVEGMGYAIPISTVEDIIAKLSILESRSPVDSDKQGYLGIQGHNIDESTSETYDMPVGVYIYKILENGAAENSGLMEKDILVELDGQRIRSMEELKNRLSYYEAGSSVHLLVKRLQNSEYVDVEIEMTLGEKVFSD